MTGLIGRRIFLKDVGRGTLAIAVFGLVVACASEADEPTTPPAPGTTTPPEPTTTEAPGTTPTTEAPDTTAPSTTEPAASGLIRVDLGFVSAYIVARGGETAVVDTGVPGSGPDILAGLESAGLGWDSVGHVILTHLHPDHIGSLADVLTNAAEATGYAGAPDIPGIPSPRPLVAVEDGEVVFDLEIIATPGHTAGHISVLDPALRLLVAGDALNGVGGGVVGANPEFTDDMAQANESIKKLAGFDFDTVVFGHGEPVEGNAAAEVAELAAGL